MLSTMQTLTWQGMSGNRYTFNVYPVGAALADIPCVYVFINSNGRFYAQYVGETHSAYERLYLNLTSHQAWSCAKARGAQWIGILPINGPRVYRLNIETDLRRALNPPCNLQ